MVSIIVPNYNHFSFLRQRIESILNQSFQEFELILLDDCSTDGSWDLLKSYSNHSKVSHCIRNETNSGSPFQQWKKGLELAKYDWIWIAESDDFSDYEFLNRMAKKIDISTNVIFCKSNFIDKDNFLLNDESEDFYMVDFRLEDTFFEMSGKEFIRNFLILRNYLLNASSVLFRKPNNFPEKVLSMKFCGDWYLWIFLLQNGKVKYIPNALNYFRIHFDSTRNYKGKEMEFKGFQELFRCIDFSFKLSGINLLSKIKWNEYDGPLRNYFHYTHKLGRFRWSAIFPDIPIVFYFKYYQLFFFSLIKRRVS